MQVKVEEVEMETPIFPPDNPQQISSSIIKQEQQGEQSKSGLRQAPEQSSLENAEQEKRKQSETAAGRSDELGSSEESFTGENNMLQRENKKSSSAETSQRLNQQEESPEGEGTLEEISEGSTEQDPAGEAASMVGWDKEGFVQN